MKFRIILTLILLTTGILLVNALPDGKLHIIMCDVGQGEAILIRTPKAKNYIIDTGPDNSVLTCMTQKISPFYVYIKGLFITHPHADHITGAIELLDRYPVEMVVLNTIKYDSPQINLVQQQIENKKIQIKETNSGDYINMDKNISGYILYPEKSAWNRKTGQWEGYLNDLNDASIIISLLYEQTMILFTGDAGCAVLNKIPDNQAYKEQVSKAKKRILKIPHHGSKTGTCQKFIQNYHPHIGLISAGRNNQFNVPNEQLIDEYKKIGTKIVRTDIQGTIEMTIDRNTIKIKTTR